MGNAHWAWFTCVRVSPLVSGMTPQDQMEVMRQTKEKVKRVGEMPNARHMFGITLVAKIECKQISDRNHFLASNVKA